MRISAHFESGSIGVIAADQPDDIRLELLPDNASDFRQWFHFRIAGAKGRPLTLRIVNAGGSNANKGLIGMPDPWIGYRAHASYDLADWFRLPTTYDGRELRIAFTPAHDSIHLANFAPYPLQRHRELIARAQTSPRVALEVLGRTPDGENLDLLQVGAPAPGRKRCWVIARQHPGEPQGSWCAEGLLNRLLDEGDALSRALLEKAVFYIAPNMNPDGSRRGNTRTNALGANLNREWIAPTMARAPEVALVKRRMEAAGVDFCLDLHAWSGRHIFALGPHHVPSLTAKQTALWKRYEAALARANPDFEAGWPYPGGGPAPGQADLSLCWNYASETWGAFGLLYELVFGDNERRPDTVGGWSVERCRTFGASSLDALAAIIDDLGP
jgi:murein tripeptide amidase MpaA